MKREAVPESDRQPTEPVPLRLEHGPAWTTDDSARLYQVPGWSGGFFGINDRGHVCVRPTRSTDEELDLFDVVRGLSDRGIITPILINFTDLLNQRIDDITEAFRAAIEENEYQGRYSAVYPIKVNQQRYLVERVEEKGRSHGYGLEVGSKPELLVAMGLTAETPDRLIVCNGFKEERYIRHIMLANKLGRQAIAVIENLNELDLLIDLAAEYGVRPRLGVRVNLSLAGSGRWGRSSGSHAKFGLSVSDLLQVADKLRARDMLDCLVLLHCHLGSQLNDIRVINDGIGELARIYSELVQLGVPLQYLDVGGGLGVDYDGSQSNHDFSINYSLQEYANTVVYRVMSICDEAGIAHPTIITEAGRATVTYQSVLVFEVLGGNHFDRHRLAVDEPELASDELPRVLGEMVEIREGIDAERLLESYHDAQGARGEALSLFNLGHLSLEQCALANRLYLSICLKLVEIAQGLESIPEELENLAKSMRDIYFCNFSVFQSLADAWAIDQVFPVMPIHRLDEEPDRRATLADVTCDSDGCLDSFISEDGIDSALRVHTLRSQESYYVAAFLVGAYQETLGDLHNLFGDANSVYLRYDADHQWSLQQVVEGDTVADVLGYYQYDIKKLVQSIRNDCERSVRDGHMTASESRDLLHAYQSGLRGYTYLE